VFISSPVATRSTVFANNGDDDADGAEDVTVATARSTTSRKSSSCIAFDANVASEVDGDVSGLIPNVLLLRSGLDPKGSGLFESPPEVARLVFLWW
jgi:hypothetical protein